MIPFKDVSWQALSLTIVPGECDVNSLQPLEESVISTRDLSLKVGILGASHYARMTIGNLCLTEVFACEAPADCESTTMHTLPEKGLSISRRHASYEYEFVAKPLAWDSKSRALIDRLLEKIDSSKGSVVLSYDFPMLDDSFETDQPPLTVVAGSIVSNKIEIETIHSYPQEAVVVYSRSVVTPR